MFAMGGSTQLPSARRLGYFIAQTGAHALPTGIDRGGKPRRQQIEPAREILEPRFLA
jgi:hypothetical protein